QLLPAHQGRDGAAAGGGGLRIARYPAAVTAARLARRGAPPGARGTGLAATGESPAARQVHCLPCHPGAYRGRRHARGHLQRPTRRAALHLRGYRDAGAPRGFAHARADAAQGARPRTLVTAVAGTTYMRATPAIAVALLLAACSSLPAPPPAPPPGGAAIAQAAAALIGTPYQFGGADAAGFDCSGLARYVHERAGLAIPRTAAEQQRAAHPVPLKQLQPGDLVFFH